jgi:hypothetical protein
LLPSWQQPISGSSDGNICLAHTYLLRALWHYTHPQTQNERSVTRGLVYWQGASFRFSLSTLQRTPTVGRLVIIDTHTPLAKLWTSVYVTSCSSWSMSLLQTGYTLDSNLFRQTP